VSHHISAFVRRYSAGRSWWPRAPLLLVLAWIFLQILGSMHYASPFSGINLIAHEAGHLFLLWFGAELLTALGGTLFQLLIPAAMALAFVRQGDPFAVTVALFWLGESTASVAPYAADARSQLLDLVSPGPGIPQHDWTLILGRLGLLEHDQLVGQLFRTSGILTMAAALGAGIWVLRVMAEAGSSADGGQPQP